MSSGRVLGDISRKLDTLMTGVESKFMRMGGWLQQVHLDIGQATEEALSTLHPFTNGDNSIINRIRSLIQDYPSLMNTCSSALKDRSNDIGVLQRKLFELSNALKGLKTIVTRLRILYVAFEVEHARNEKAVTTFTTFLKRMDSFIEEIYGVYEEMRHDLQSVSERQKVINQNVLSGIERMGRLSAAVEKALLGAGSEVSVLVDNSVSNMSAMTASLQGVTSKIGQIVVAMQVHDITRQQVEHVINALDDYNFADTPAIVRVQVAQLEQVAESVTAAHKVITGSFQAISEDIDSLLRVQDKGNGDIGIDTLSKVCEKMLDSIQQLSDLNSRHLAILNEVQEAMSEVEAMTSRLESFTEQVQEINEQIHMQAVNAVINAEHLGLNGRGISVLADEVMRVADYSKVVTVDISDSLGELLVFMHTSAQDTHDGLSKASGEGVTMQLESLVKEAVSGLSSMRDVSRGSGVRAERLKSELCTAISSTDFLLEFDKELHRQLQRLSEEVALIDDDYMNNAIQGDAHESNMKRYTMESERVVHLRALGLDSKPRVNDGDDDEFGSNVELF